MTKTLRLPRISYGPICLKILDDFIKHHNLPDLPKPQPNNTVDDALSKIFDIILHSLGDEKRDAILKEVEEYCQSIPPSAR